MTIGIDAPYWLDSIEGIGTPSYMIHTTKGSTQDGENYVSSNAEMRGIDIVAVVSENVIENVRKLYDIFIPKKKGVLTYYRDCESSEIEYIVECVTPVNNGYIKLVNISLNCPDPFFQETRETKVNIAYWQGFIEFPLELPVEPFEMTTKIQNLIVNLQNDSNIDLGMTIQFIANGNLINPSLFNVNTRVFFKVNTAMITGDVITITTHYKNKKVYLTRNGLESDITYLMDYESTWLKVYDGDNLYRYDADEGIDHLDANIYYRKLRLGVV